MLQRINNFLSSARATVILLLFYAVLMAVATFLEKYRGTETAKALIYYSPAFFLLHLLMVINCVALTLRRRLLRRGKWGYALTHLAMAVILTGATLTHLLGREGMIALREGETKGEMICREGGHQWVEELPFALELIDFRLVRYPGSQSPSSYESDLLLHDNGHTDTCRIYMNHVLDHKGYRFFQASFDSDERGTILSVNHDVAGRGVTYTGYVLLIVGLSGCLLGRGSRFRALCRQLKIAAVVVAVAGAAATARAAEIAPEHAEAFGHLPMQSINGRIVPVSTFAEEVVRKLRIRNAELKPEQLLLELIIRPAQWASVPLITVEESDVRKVYTEGRRQISYRDAFDRQGHYKYAAAVERIYQLPPARRTHTDRELLKLDERINLLHQLFNFEMLRLFPIPQDTLHHKWIAAGDDLSRLSPRDSAAVVTMFRSYRTACTAEDWSAADRLLEEIRRYQNDNRAGLVIDTARINAEVSYNRYNLEAQCRRGYLVMGAVLLLLTLTGGFRREVSRRRRYALTTLTAIVALIFVLHTCALAMRWYISEHAPWSNSYETMIFMAWTAVAGGFCFLRQSRVTLALATLFAGVVLFVAGLNWMDPEITGLVPVLKSPWLMFHVAVLMIAYGFMGMGCMISTLNLISMTWAGRDRHPQLRAQIARMTVINELALTVGMALMMAGIFLGAVWANESWGRYWSWDPKETWALITAVVYAALLHRRWLAPQKGDLWFNIGGQWAFVSVLMTYFGVNYLLSGMHSYGNTSGLSDLPGWVIAAFLLIFLLPAVLAAIRFRQVGKTDERR